MPLIDINMSYQKYLVIPLLPLLLLGCSSSNNNGAANSNDTVNGYHLVRSVDYNQFGQVTESETYQYDFDANRIDIERMQTENSELGVFIDPSAQEFYDEQGRLTLRETPRDQGFRRNTYAFNSAGLLERYETTGGFFTIVADLEYDSLGNLVKAVESSPAVVSDPEPRAVVRTYNYFFNSDGFLASSNYEQALFDAANVKEVVDASSTTYSYDDQGRRISAVTTDSPPIMDDSVFTRVYKYDSNGNVSERTVSDSVGFIRRTEYFYEASPEPIYNFWLRSFKYFP